MIKKYERKFEENDVTDAVRELHNSPPLEE
jgi:hypothetical protein